MKNTFAYLIMILCILSACTQNDPVSLPADEAKIALVLYNWEDYVDKTVLDEFEEEFGIKVLLKEYEVIDEAISNIQANPQEYDVIVLTAFEIQTLQELKLLEKIDMSKIPNSNYLMDEFMNRPFDPQNSYSLPYLWGTTGLAIDTDVVPEDTDSWSVLWDPAFKGKIILLDDTRESIGVVQKYLGFSLNTKDPDEIKRIKTAAIQLKQNGVQFSDTFDNIERLKSGEAAIVQVYNGDIIYAAKEAPNIKYVLPESGFEIWSDNFVISVDSTHKEEAHMLINYLLRPDINARNAEKFAYATPNKEAQKLISKELLENPYVYIDEERMAIGETIMSVGETNAEYNRIFSLMK
ncbi:MAG: spermidine/putrescine ABC transporter substrate-binding protein [Nanoarchaeota archaeon]